MFALFRFSESQIYLFVLKNANALTYTGEHFDTRTGITADWDEAAAMKTYIANAWHQHCTGGIPATNGDIAPYSRRATAHQLAELLNGVI